MAIEVRCACGHCQRVADRAAGPVRCEGCGRSIAVGGVTAAPGASKPPAARRVEPRDERPAPTRAKSGGINVGLIVAIVLIPLFLCGVGGIVLVMFLGFGVFRSSASGTFAGNSQVTVASGRDMPVQPINPPDDPARFGPFGPPGGQQPLPGGKLEGLLAKFNGTFTMSASSYWGGYTPTKMTDGDPNTSWFSGTGDAAALGKSPWVEVTFPEDVTIKSVQILGNREALYPTGYAVTSGQLTLFDQNRQAIRTVTADGVGKEFDFEFKFIDPVNGVRSVRFTSTKDQGDQNGTQDVALGEIRIE